MGKVLNLASLNTYRSIWRNSRRSAYALIGVALSVSFVVGSFLAIDSSASALLDAAIESVHAHVVMETYELQQLNGSDVSHAVELLETVTNIDEVRPIAWVPQWTFSNGSRFFDQARSGYIGFLAEDSNAILSSYDISGNTPEVGEAAVSARMADALNLRAGDTFTAQYSSVASNESTGAPEWRFVNFTFRVSGVWFQDGSLSGDVRIYFENPVILNMQEADSVLGRLQSEFGGDRFMILTYLVWADLQKLIVDSDVRGTLSNVDRMTQDLQASGADLGLDVVESNLEEAIDALSADLESANLVFLELSIPVMSVGTYLSAVGINLSSSERRRETAILRSRGASSKQILINVLLESIVLGAVAGIVGLMLGAVISRPLLSSTSGIAGASVEVEWSQFNFSLFSFLIAVLLGVVLTTLASVGVILRSLKFELAEALHHQVPAETSVRYDPRWDVFSLALVATCIAGVTLPEDAITHRVNSFAIQQLILGFRVFAISVFPIAPILLSVSTVRLATRGHAQVYTRIARITKFLGNEIEYFVRKSIDRDFRRSQTFIMVISLVLCFGIFVSVTSDSTMAYELRKVEYDVGADVRAEATIPDSYVDGLSGVNLSILNQVSLFQEVRELCWFYSPRVTVSGVSEHMAIIDASAYNEVVQPGDFWFVQRGSKAIADLERNGTAIVREDFANSAGIEIGDTISALISLHNSTTGDYTPLSIDLNVIDLARKMPGFDATTILYVDLEALGTVADEHLANTTDAKIGVLIDLEPGGYPGAFAVVVGRIFRDAGLQPSVIDLQLSLKTMTLDPKYAMISDFLGTEYGISIMISSVGLAMTIIIAVDQRRFEFGAILARGCSRSQIRRILMAESFVLLIVSLTIGLSAGLLASYLYNSFQVYEYDQLGRALSVTADTLWLLLISIASFVLATLLASFLAGRMKVSEVLRIRGG